MAKLSYVISVSGSFPAFCGGLVMLQIRLYWASGTRLVSQHIKGKAKKRSRLSFYLVLLVLLITFCHIGHNWAQFKSPGKVELRPETKIRTHFMVPKVSKAPPRVKTLTFFLVLG